MKSYEIFFTKKKFQDSLYHDITFKHSYEQQHQEIVQNIEEDTSAIVLDVFFSGSYNELIVPYFHEDTNVERE